MEETISKLIVYGTIIILLAFLTLFTFESWDTVIFAGIVVMIMSYIVILIIDRLTVQSCNKIAEGFVNESEAELSKYEWLNNEDLFDDFYASIFTKLTQNENLIQAETAICVEEFARKMPKEHLSILDAGCGIGIGTCSFVKQGINNVVGIDRSQAMIRYAKGTTVPNTTLTEHQRQDLELRLFDLMGPGAAAAGEFTDACLLYFTVYYFRDLGTLFRNLALWVKPGGHLAVEVVNKYKFEPILDASNPWVGISPQNYVKERLTKSHVVFDEFDYEAVFELEDPQAEFRETFRFKDGSVRRQKHSLIMPSIAEIIKKAQENGWKYTKYVDLMPLSFAYGYLLFFDRAD
jgi:SAM-dependent methyltransferase